MDNFVKLIKEDLVVHDMFLEVYKGNGFLDIDSYLILNKDILGQEKGIHQMIETFQHKQLPISFFIYGPTSCGKTLTAKSLAKYLNYHYFHDYYTVIISLNLFCWRKCILFSYLFLFLYNHVNKIQKCPY